MTSNGDPAADEDGAALGDVAMLRATLDGARRAVEQAPAEAFRDEETHVSAGRLADVLDDVLFVAARPAHLHPPANGPQPGAGQ